MRIAFVAVGCLSINASIKRAIGLAPWLISAGVDVCFVLEDLQENRKLEREFRDARFLFYKSSSFLGERGQKKRLLMEYGPDVIFSCGLGFRNLPTWRRANRMLLIVDHGELESFKGSGVKALLMYCLEWAVLLFADGHVAASRYIEFLFRHRLFLIGKKRPILWLPYAADAGASTAYVIGQAAVSRYVGKKVVLYFGSLASNYGCFDMLAAASRVLSAKSDVVFVFCGKGPDYFSFKKLAESDVNAAGMEVLGYVDDARLEVLIARADVHLCPLNDTISDWARCPSKIYMQMLNQAPIVTCRVGEAYEVLHGAGFYYNAGDAFDMANAVFQALSYVGADLYDLDSISWRRRSADFLEWVRRNFKSGNGVEFSES